MRQITDEQLKRLELAVDTIQRSVEQIEQMSHAELATPVDRIRRGNRIVAQVLQGLLPGSAMPGDDSSIGRSTRSSRELAELHTRDDKFYER